MESGPHGGWSRLIKNLNAGGHLSIQYKYSSV